MIQKAKMNTWIALLFIAAWLIGNFAGCRVGTPHPRVVTNFNAGWKFHPGYLEQAQSPAMMDTAWRNLDLPHDWSIEGEFSQSHPATAGGGALPGAQFLFRCARSGWFSQGCVLFLKRMDGQAGFTPFSALESCCWCAGRCLGVCQFR